MNSKIGTEQIKKFQFNSFIPIHTKQLVLGLTT